ncbi:MAG: hypothetical protein NVV59_02325 [Chitinophagaceae bacterium]|nr:hypothetical protein [Chitinophagaceae bacterium]
MLKKTGLFLLLLSVLSGNAQTDTSLTARLQRFLEFTENLDVDAALDLTYPRLFTIVTREEMKKELLGSQDEEEAKIRIDSLRIDTIFPVFQHEKGSYTKIAYTLNIYLQLVGENATEDETELMQLKEIYQSLYGEDNVSYNAEKKEFKLRSHAAMIGIRDDISPEWTFLNFEIDSPLTGILFGDKLLEKLALYK